MYLQQLLLETYSDPVALWTAILSLVTVFAIWTPILKDWRAQALDHGVNRRFISLALFNISGRLGAFSIALQDAVGEIVTPAQFGAGMDAMLTRILSDDVARSLTPNEAHEIYAAAFRAVRLLNSPDVYPSYGNNTPERMRRQRELAHEMDELANELFNISAQIIKPPQLWAKQKEKLTLL